MQVRAILISLPIVTALVVCGCGSETPYNTPTDPAKEAAELAAATPPRKPAVGKKKAAKPPVGATLKDSKSLQPSG
jgi:hypothetical protein